MNSGGKNQNEKPFLIVGIGASAGGLEAVTELLSNLSPVTGMAFVYVQHLDPTHQSMLSVLLSKTTKMKVLEAKNYEPILPDHLYIIPPNKEMTIKGGSLKLVPRKLNRTGPLAIDIFLTSLAETKKEYAIGVVLSGTATDGTIGLKRIKNEGGFTFAQDETAKFQSMPKSAIAEGVVDLVLSPKDIAAELEKLSEHAGQISEFIGDEESTDTKDFDDDLVTILQLLKKSTGVDFSHYKRKTIGRRLIRRMVLHKLRSLADYSKYLRQHTPEINLLYQDLLINVTNFFRDPPALDYLKEKILPEILKSKSPKNPIRIWVPACSTGQEAYSLAILVLEILGESASDIPIQIFATDLSEIVIAKARLGTYSQNELLEVSAQRLQQFFKKVDGSYRINKQVRDICVFAVHNVLKDPAFSRIDLISCCNFLIYLDIALQQKIISTFHYALNETGYLMLGKSETVGSQTNLFSQTDKKIRIYACRKDVPVHNNFENKYGDIDREKATLSNKISIRKTDSLELATNAILLSTYVPASVVVNRELEILQFRGSTGLFLEPSPGKASLNLLKMARQGLAFELRNIVHKSSTSGEPVKKTGIEVKYKGSIHIINIEAVPFKPEDDEQYFLVLFEEMPAPKEKKTATVASAKNSEVKLLEAELMSVREDMRAIIEEAEAANEELQSANEEIISSNEELQSVNEELQTSKEEIESTNEELITTNQELQTRNQLLTEAHNYNQAIFSNMRESMIILDKNLRIRSANDRFYNVFHLNSKDIEGLILYDLGNREWNIPKLRELLEEIIPKNTRVHGYELSQNFSNIGEKVLLINAERLVQKVHHEDLILLAIEDITEQKRVATLIPQREWYRSMADTAPVMIWMADRNRGFTYFNKTWLEYRGRSLEQELGNGWMNGIHPDDLERCVNAFNTGFKKQENFSIEFRIRRKDGAYRWILNICKPTYLPDREFIGFIGSCNEIHDQRLLNAELEKKVEEKTYALQEANRNLERSNSELQQFAYAASHDLQEPLRKIQTFSDRLNHLYREELPEVAKNYIEKINAASQRMTRLIQDLLNFSRVGYPNEFIKTNLNEILNDVLKDFDLKISQEEAAVNIQPLPEIEAVPLQMTQLFMNLFSNSFKFRKSGRKPVINIRSRKLSMQEVNQRQNADNNNSYYEIIFEDNGIGFNQKFSEQAFIIFQRLHDHQVYPGTGIGLALCRKIVLYHDGEIYAESAENKGASFHIILPEKHSSASGLNKTMANYINRV